MIHRKPKNKRLYSLTNLIIVIVCTPILYFIIKKTKYCFILLLGVFWFIRPFISIPTMDFDTSFFFFGFGAYMSINKKDMLVSFGRYFKPSLWLYAILGVLYVFSVHYFPEATFYIKRCNVVVGLIFAYNLAAWLLQRGFCKCNKFLSSASFFIYVAHNLICFKIHKLMMAILQPFSDIGVLTVYCFAVILCIMVLLGIFYVMQRYTPGMLKVLVGRK